MKKELYEGHREDWSITGFGIFDVHSSQKRPSKKKLRNIILSTGSLFLPRRLSGDFILLL